MPWARGAGETGRVSCAVIGGCLSVLRWAAACRSAAHRVGVRSRRRLAPWRAGRTGPGSPRATCTGVFVPWIMSARFRYRSGFATARACIEPTESSSEALTSSSACGTSAGVSTPLDQRDGGLRRRRSPCSRRRASTRAADGRPPPLRVAGLEGDERVRLVGDEGADVAASARSGRSRSSCRARPCSTCDCSWPKNELTCIAIAASPPSSAAPWSSKVAVLMSALNRPSSIRLLVVVDRVLDGRVGELLLVGVDLRPTDRPSRRRRAEPAPTTGSPTGSAADVEERRRRPSP